MEIAVYGTGAMGTVLGAFLCRAGYAPDLISRDQAHITALKTAGAKIGGTVSFSTPPFDGREGRGRALLPTEISKKYDIIFLLTKQTDNAVTAETLNNVLAPGGVVCIMQNGIPEPALAAILGEDKVLGCICIWGADKPAIGMAELTSRAGSMRFVLGGIGGNSHPMLPTVQEILEKVCPVTVKENFIGARWSKLLINAAFSGLSAVTGYSFGAIAADHCLGNYALHIIKECIEVCRAAGIAIEPVQGKFPARFLYFKSPLKKFILSRIMPLAMRSHHAIKSGMLHDLERGRTSEIEAINGEVCRTGRKYNVPTPYNDRIVAMVHAIERGERKCGPHNLKDFP
ncbi:MAG: ketopantoate reductase family protein [Treponema sp.]|jgi:2-dehydropantoate 2-reductase|nr:ketopantoate reductase family protein [Treponema sp.]